MIKVMTCIYILQNMSLGHQINQHTVHWKLKSTLRNKKKCENKYFSYIIILKKSVLRNVYIWFKVTVYVKNELNMAKRRIYKLLKISGLLSDLHVHTSMKFTAYCRKSEWSTSPLDQRGTRYAPNKDFFR